MLLSIAIVSLILLVWFRTDAWLEYCRLWRLDELGFYKDYDDKKYMDVTLTYHSYLRRHHNCFGVRLITCPICLAVWLGLIVGICSGMAFQFPIIVVGALIVFGAVDRLLG